MMRALLGVLFLLGAALGATFDQGLTISARGGLSAEKLYFTFREIAPPRRTSGHHHTLLSLAFPGHSRFSLILDRAQGQVVVESVWQGETEKERVAAPASLREGRGTVESLLVEVDQGMRVVTVYGDCDLLGTVDLTKVPKDMIDDEMRLYRDRHVEVSVDWGVTMFDLLDKLGCSDTDPADVQAQGNEIYTYRRGDIPILHDDQSYSKLVSIITELIETIKELQIEIQTQREETSLLRDALINCEACKPGRRFRGR